LVLILSYNKTNSDWRHRSSLKIFPSVCKVLLSAFGLKAALYEPLAKNFQRWPCHQSPFVSCL